MRKSHRAFRTHALLSTLQLMKVKRILAEAKQAQSP
jgi:hypothetical protein